jgi:hypothetical protein
MIITPTEHDAPNESSDPTELLIKEARQKARRRRLVVGTTLLAVVVIIAAILIFVGREPVATVKTQRSGTSGAVGTSLTSGSVVNLAGVSTITASGSHAWVTIDYTAYKGDRAELKKNRYEVVELNTSSGALERVIKNKAGDLIWPQGTAVSGSNLWVGTNNSVTELNANNGSLVRVINAKADKLTGLAPLSVSDGRVWIAGYADHTGSVTELNASNGSLVRVINAKADGLNGPQAIVASGSHVFVLNALGDSVTELNASNGSLVRVINAHAGCCVPRSGTFESAEPIALAVNGSSLWVTDQHAPANGGDANNFLVELNASNGSLVRTISAKADHLTDPDDIEVSGGHVWVENDDYLTELNASNGSLVRVIKVNKDRFDDFTGFAVSGSRVLALNTYSGNDGAIKVLNANNGKLVRVIK